MEGVRLDHTRRAIKHIRQQAGIQREVGEKKQDKNPGSAEFHLRVSSELTRIADEAEAAMEIGMVNR